MTKPTLCPQCKDPKLTLWNNKGVGKNNRDYENYKCKCGYLKWIPQEDKPASTTPQGDISEALEGLAKRVTALESENRAKQIPDGVPAEGMPNPLKDMPVIEDDIDASKIPF